MWMCHTNMISQHNSALYVEKCMGMRVRLTIDAQSWTLKAARVVNAVLGLKELKNDKLVRVNSLATLAPCDEVHGGAELNAVQMGSVHLI